MGKKELQISGILSITLGVIMILSVVFGVFGIFSLIAGIIFVNYTKLNDEEFYKKNNSILLWSIVLIFANVIASIFSFMSLDKIGSDVKSKRVLDVDDDMKKLNIILMVGIGMVTISALIFSTNNKEILGGVFNSILLLVLSFVFLILSKFVKDKIKITMTVVSYFILGLVFILCSYLSISSFEIFGEWFTLSGVGKYLYISGFYYLSASLVGVLSKRFNKKYLLYYVGVLKLVGFAYLLYFFNLKDYIWLILLVVTGVGLLLNDKGYFFIGVYYNLSRILFLLISLLIVFNNFILGFMGVHYISSTQIVVALVSVALITIFNFYGYIRNKNVLYSFLFPIYNIIITFTSLGLFSLTANININIICLVGLITYFISVLFKDKRFHFISSIVVNIFLLLLFLFSFSYSYTPLLVITVLLIINIFSLYKLDYIKYEVWLQPIKLLLLAISVIHLVNFVNYKFLIVYLICSIVFLFMYLLNKGKSIGNIYLFFGMFTIFLACYIYNYGSYSILFRLGFLAITLTYFYLLKNNNTKVGIIAKDTIYLLLFLVIYSVYDCFALNFSSNIVAYILLFTSYLGILLVVNKKLYNMIASLMIFIPLFKIINFINFSNEINIIVKTCTFLYLLYIFNKLFINKIKVRNVLNYIFIPIIYLTIIFNSSIIVVIFIAVSALLFILFGYYNKYYNSLYNLGIIITISNLVINLENLWDDISIWIYLLAIGLFIIIFGTYKLLKLNDQSEVSKKEDSIVLAFELDNKLVWQAILYSILVIILIIMV